MIIFLIVFSILILFFIIYFLIGFFVCRIAYKRKLVIKPHHTDLSNIENQEWFYNTKSEDIFIDSYDGLKLSGKLFLNKNIKNFIITVHGYRGKKIEMSHFASIFYEKGYSILMVDNRGNGESEGKYITMGYKDVYDIVSWVNYLNKNYENINIILYGWSMGGAIVMASSAFVLNTNVKVIIEDCGYSSIYHQFLNIKRKNIKLFPDWLIMSSTSFISKLIYKIDIKKNSPIISLSKSNIPTLFIHGDKDQIVDTNLIYKNYDALKINKKEMKIFSDSKHVSSLFNHTKEYTELVSLFISKYIS